MATRRGYGSYDDGCAAAHALDLVGERWALIVVRELILGPKRFGELRSGVLGASPPVLVQRLRSLEEKGVLRRRAGAHGVTLYELTDWGRGLGPVLEALGRWGARSPAMPHGASVSPETCALSMRTMHDDEVLRDVDVRLELRIGDDVIRIDTHAGLEVERGSSPDPDAIVECRPHVWTALLFYGRELDEAIRAGDIVLTGDPTAVERFLDAFPALTPATADAR